MSLCVRRTSRKYPDGHAETRLMNAGDRVATIITERRRACRPATDFREDVSSERQRQASRYGGTLASPVLRNPQTRRWC